MNKALIAVGSNLGDKNYNIFNAIELIKKNIGPIIKKSLIYETKPIGNTRYNFLNGAILINTKYNPYELLDLLLQIESSLGRIRNDGPKDRTIDLDIILFKQDNRDIIINEPPKLVIPHSQTLKRDFVLVPCSEIAPDWIFPHSGRSLKKEAEDRKYFLDKKNAP